MGSDVYIKLQHKAFNNNKICTIMFKLYSKDFSLYSKKGKVYLKIGHSCYLVALNLLPREAKFFLTGAQSQIFFNLVK